MKVLVCGGRDFKEVSFLEHALNEIDKEVGRISFIINGAAEGADRHSSTWARNHGIHYAEMPALWQYNGKSAGPKRNNAMIECFNPDLIVAFPGGAGTENMVKLGHANNIEVIDLRSANVVTKPEETDYEKFLRNMEVNVGRDLHSKSYWPVPPTTPYIGINAPTYDTATPKDDTK